MAWKIRIGDKELPAEHETSTNAVREFMLSEQRNSCGGDSIKEFGVHVVCTTTFEAYRLDYPTIGDKFSLHIATCGGSIVLRNARELQTRLKAEAKEDAEMFAWLHQRDRWASCSAHFEKGGVYRDHVVVYYDPHIGWIHAKPGNGFREAVRNAMNMRVNYETGEYFNPPD